MGKFTERLHNTGIEFWSQRPGLWLVFSDWPHVQSWRKKKRLSELMCPIEIQRHIFGGGIYWRKDRGFFRSEQHLSYRRRIHREKCSSIMNRSTHLKAPQGLKPATNRMYSVDVYPGGVSILTGYSNTAGALGNTYKTLCHIHVSRFLVTSFP